MKSKKIYYIFIPLFILTVLAIVIFSNEKAMETVRKQTAQILKTEFIPNQNRNIENCEVFTQKDSIYEDFRSKYRFQFQTIGVAAFSDSSRLIVISEPPPYFEIDSIKSILSKFTHAVETKNHRFGYDGFVTDILISMVNATDENVQNIVRKLSEALYLSDYKPISITLPVEEKRIYFSEENLDYQISLYEFHEWFLKNDESFIQLQDTNTTYTVSSIFENKHTGVFFSEMPGFVAWALPKKADMADHIRDIRQFTLDADLILGALADTSMLVIIGRERETPLHELPPLYVETILLLASITEKELSQSLDINDFLAGKMKNGRDWCPTYLSKELEHTEFGNLMTLTDILLKDWSESGTIQEYNFRYPKPKYYPFRRPLFRLLGLNELVYNWNTANAMYAIDLPEATIYTLNRTGSLPVSYFNSQERAQSIGRQYERQAYNYFANLGNTDLIRVVQYTALYQLFIDNEITYSGELHNAPPKNKPYLLVTPTKNLLNVFKDLKDEQITFVSDSASKRMFALYQKDKVMEQIRDNEAQYNYKYEEQEIERIMTRVKGDNKTRLTGEFKSVRSMLQNLSEEQFNNLARQLAYPRGQRVNDQATYQTYLRARQLNKLMHSLGKNNLDLLGLDLNNVKNYFVNNLSHSSAKYLKTPSVIVTFNDMVTTGGHNLSSKISRVNSMQNYKRDGGGGGGVRYAESGERPAVSGERNADSGERKTTSGGQPQAAKPKTTTSTNTASNQKPANQPTIRPRTEVVAGGARPQRGL
ncbi:MAG: hypothetical protein FWC34_05685 [Bacteroidetes bacterium]|nr:hypothetical protein [Bacteroidota bacterium]MCL2302464.1 hypothetical protein [Lentimicrobiaceae bacterium]